MDRLKWTIAAVLCEACSSWKAHPFTLQHHVLTGEVHTSANVSLIAKARLPCLARSGQHVESGKRRQLLTGHRHHGLKSGWPLRCSAEELWSQRLQ